MTYVASNALNSHARSYYAGEGPDVYAEPEPEPTDIVSALEMFS